MPAPSTSMCFVTFGARRDLEPLGRLRRTLAAFAPDLPHRVVVPQEDLAVFRRRFPDGAGHGLVLLGTRAVLPPRAERGRRLAAAPVLGRTLERFAQDFGLLPPERAAQLARIFALAAIPEDFGVFLDPGVELCRPVSAAFFLREGRPRLFEAPAETVRQAAFDISTHILMGTPLHRVHRLYDYGTVPAVFRRATALALLARLEERAPQGWLRDFLLLRHPSEWNLLGFAARELESHRGYHVEQRPPGGWDPEATGWCRRP